MTMGQAIDAAIKTHETRYQGSTVFSTECREWNTRFDQAYKVELNALHFSSAKTYFVNAENESISWND